MVDEVPEQYRKHYSEFAADILNERRRAVRMANLDFDSHPAGPEMDRLVAEEVMGWKLADYNGPDWYEVSDTACRRIQPLAIRDTESDQRASCFHPSTDIAHAWEVVEKMPRVLRRHGMDGEFTVSRNSDGLWFAGYDQGNGSGWDPCESADSAPLAICRAALKAVR